MSDTLRPYTPRVAARWLRDQPNARHQAVDGSLVSADISGFTALSERLAEHGRAGAEAVVDVVNGCFEEMIAAATAYGGDVLKFGGDALLLLFEGEDHAPRAAVACAALRAVLVEPRSHPLAGDTPLSMSIGMHSGTFHLFLGRGSHAELIIAGRDASTAVQCESDAQAGQILASEASASLLDRDWRSIDQSSAGGGVLLTPPLAVDDLLVPTEVIDGIDYGALVAPSLARHLVDGSMQSQIRPVTTAFISFSGLDDAIENAGPRRVARNLQALVEVVSQATDAFKVHWLDTDIAVDGGKVHLTAGAPTATDDDDAAMLHAVRAILDTCANPPLAAGVNHGIVFTGDVGATTRRTLAAMGDSVNLAARLSGKAGAGELVASLAVLEGSGTTFEAVPLEPFTVKGKSRPILAAKVGQPAAAEPEDQNDLNLPLVARGAELATLLEAAGHAASGDPRVVLMRGPRGIGKSRLAHELRTLLGDTVSVLATSCDPHQAATPFAPFRDLLCQVAGVDQAADPVSVGAGLLAHLRKAAPEMLPWAPLLAMPLGAVVPPTPETDRVAPAFRRLRLQQAVTDYLRAVLTGPTLLLFEDVEWLDEASKDLLADLLLGVFDRPWCLVMASTLDTDTDTDAEVINLQVTELADDAMTRLAGLALGDLPILPRDVANLVEVAAGHPLFLLELIAQARETGQTTTLPRTVEAAVTTRLDLLAPSELAQLRELSVLGVEIPAELARQTLGDEATDPARWTSMLHFVEVREDGLTFRETLYRQVAYEGLAFGRRTELHARAADALRANPNDSLKWVVDLALHEDHAGRHERAWETCVEAGDAMRAVWATADAAAQYRRALANAEQVPSIPDWRRAEVAERLGDVSEIASIYETSIAAYEQALALTPRATDQARLLHKAARTDLQQAEYERGIGRLEAALDLLRDETRDSVVNERAAISEEQGRIRYRQARFVEAEMAADHALKLIGDRDPLLHARAQFIVASCRMQQNDPRAAAGLVLALDVFMEHGDLISQGHCHTNLGLVEYYRGDWTQAAKHYQSAQQLYGDAGYAKGAAMQCLNFGEILSNQQRWDEALRAFQDAKRRYRAMGSPLGIASANGHLGWIRAATGDVHGGLELLRSSVTMFEELGAPDFLAVSRTQLAEVLAQNGAIDEAAALVSAVLEENPQPVIRSAVARVEARLAVLRGDTAAARASVARAIEIARTERLPFEEATAAAFGLANGLVDADGAAAQQAAVTATFEDLGVDRAVTSAARDREHGRADRAHQRLAQAEAKLATSASPASTLAHVRLQAEEAAIYFREGRFDAARESIQEASNSMNDGTPGDVRARVTFVAACIQMQRLEPEAKAGMTQALAEFTALGDLTSQARATANLGTIAFHAGNLDEARSRYREARSLFREVDDAIGAATQSMNLGEVQADAGELRDALDVFEDALARFERLGHPLGMACAIANMSWTRQRLGQVDRAVRDWDAAWEAFETMGATDFQQLARARRVGLEVMRDDAPAALFLADELLAEDLVATTAVVALQFRAEALAASDRGEEAIAAATAALDLAHDRGLAILEASARQLLDRLPPASREPG